MIHLHSPAILAFRLRVRDLALRVLSREVGLEVGRTRFREGGYSYPLHVAVFEDPRLLGFFDPSFHTLGVNRSLMLEAGEGVIADVVRHEVAHLMTFVRHGLSETDHGPAFRAFCRSVGWGPGVWGATVDVREGNARDPDPGHDRLLSRVRKILALGDSPNPHEAEAAALKANELLVRHNLSRSDALGDGEEETCLKRVLRSKRRSMKLLCIADILRTFLVFPVTNSGRDGVWLEVVGDRAAVEMADYVAGALDHILERLWEGHRKRHPGLGGIRMKNSFFLGVGKGYVRKIEGAQRARFTGREITLFQAGLVERARAIYGGLSYRGIGARTDSWASGLGERAGRDLSIRKGVGSGGGGGGGGGPARRIGWDG